MTYYSIECVALSHIGNKRKNNEDNFFIGESLSPDEQKSMSPTENQAIQKNVFSDGTLNRVYAVSDGMGGHKNGEVASCMVVEAIKKFVGLHTEKPSFKHQDKFEFIQEFQKMIRQTNLDILDCSHGECELDNMGATLSGLIVFADEAVPFNIGDSSTFLYEDGVLRKLTVDDNEAERFSGIDITALEANGKRLTKYFGMAKSSGVLTARVSAPIPLRKEQIFLIASDGLTDNLSLSGMTEIIHGNEAEPKEILKRLTETALNVENGGRDNITVVVLKVHKHFK